jgi:uncharacterized protein (DUF885 family)
VTSADDIRGLAEEYWQARLADSPLLASFLGDHRYDDQADDMSGEADRRRRERWAALRERVAAIPAEASGRRAEDQAGGALPLDGTDAVTRELLLGDLDDAIRQLDLRLVELHCNQMQGAHARLLMMAGQLRAPEPEHAAMAVTRIGELARLLGQAAQRYREGAAAGRVPVRINVTRSLSQLTGYLASAPEQDPFVSLAGPPDWDATEAWRAQLADATRDVLRPAFARYRDVLAEELEPIARPDDRPGLCHLPDGEELYRALIEAHTGLPLTPEELHRIGLEEVTTQLPAEFAEVGGRAFGTSELTEIFGRLLSDPELRYRDGAEILEHARRGFESARAAIGDWFGILPEASCAVLPVPDYLAPDVPPAYYMPPAPDGSRPGQFMVNLHEPASRGRANTATVTFHEAIPGHHLQLAIATERTDLPEFRRLAVRHTAFVEGWGLYAERLADEMGLYQTDLDRLGMLGAEAWRACRLVVDTGLHAMGWTRRQAIDFMAAHAPIDLDTIRVEVDRYIGMPGQALAYKVGQREILRLREQARAELGAQFDIKGFHDTVLGAATVSLGVLGGRVRAWVDR